MADAMEAAEQLNPLRGGVLHMQDMPAAESRTKAYEMIRSVGPVDFERKQQHYAFGGGPHTCPGSQLARLKMRVVLEEWHRRIPDYRLGPGGSDRVGWPAGLIGIDSLPLVFPPRGSPA